MRCPKAGKLLTLKRRPPEQTDSDQRGRYVVFVARFLLSWLCSLALLVGTAFLLNIDWARPKIESVMSESFHRQVRLGALSWSLGLNGISIWTDKLTADGIDGEPFIRSGPSEIGMAFLPMLSGKLIVRHLSFKKPELWAVRLGESSWNFSDLIQPGLDIRLIQVESGKLHVSDRSAADKSAFKPYDFEDIKLKLVWPSQDRRWPFFLSFNLPRPEYTTHVKFTTLGYGLFERWRQNNYKFDLTADHVNPDDLGPLRHLIPDISGLFAIRLEGEGALAKGVVAKASADIEQLSVPAGSLGKLNAPAASSSANLRVDENRITWDDLSVKMGDVELRSRGQLAQWQGRSPRYQAHVSSKVSDLSKLPKVIADGTANSASVTELGPDRRTIANILAPGRLAGTAMIEVTLTGGGPVSEFLATIGADGLPAKEIVGAGLFGQIPFLDLIGLDAHSRLSGQVKIANGRVDVPEAEMIAAGGRLKASGFWDLQSDRRHFTLNGSGLKLAAIGERLAASRELAAEILKHFRIPSIRLLSLAGSMDLVGQIDGGDAARVNFTTHLKDASFALRDGSLDTGQVNGKVTFDGRALRFDNLTGKLGSGDFKLNGTAVLAGSPHIDVTLSANRLDLDQFDRALRVLRIEVPIFSGRQLYGKVREFSLSLKGNPEKPTIALAAQPEDLYYQPPGLSRALRAVSGSLTYEHDRLTLREVGLVSQHNRKLVTSLAIDDLSGAATLRRVKAKTNGLDLSDVHFYLSSPLMPPPLRQGYMDSLARYHLTGVSGTAYGDMLWQAHDADFDLSGVIGFYNVQLRAGSPGVHVEGLSGLLAASGRELIIQNMGGHVGANTFAVDGHVTDYRSPKVTWQTELRSQLSPQELIDLLPGLQGQISTKVSAAHPVSLRATISGNPKASTVIFSARADAKTKLKLASPMGSLYQPDQAITLDGSFTITPGDAGNVVLHNSHLLIGDSILQGQGSYTWFAPSARSDAILSFRLSSSNPITARSVLSVLDPSTTTSGVGGSVSLDLRADGPVTQPVVKGHVAFNDVAVPQFNLGRLTGGLETAGFVIPVNPGKGSASSRARLEIKAITVGDLAASDVSANIVVEPAATPDAAPRIRLDSGTAKIAGGEVELGGWLEIANHRLHMEAKLSKVESGQIVGQLLGQPGEINGAADGSVVLDSQGQDYDDLIRNLDGHGEIAVASGKVARFGQLQEKLTQANLLQQGLFGFNLNNLLQSVVPVRTGHFKDLRGRFEIADGLLSIKDLKFNGEDMRLRAAGTVNLPLNTITLEVAGNLPRVQSSLIGGPIGQVSRELTLQKLMSVITLNTLENLPAVPVLGDLASDRPRAFMFQVATTMDKPQAMAHSIEKSFRWLPNQTNASAHPIPGLH